MFIALILSSQPYEKIWSQDKVLNNARSKVHDSICSSTWTYNIDIQIFKITTQNCDTLLENQKIAKYSLNENWRWNETTMLLESGN